MENLAVAIKSIYLVVVKVLFDFLRVYFSFLKNLFMANKTVLGA